MAEANIDLALDGTWLRNIGGGAIHVHSWDAIWMPAPYRGANRTIPGLPGVIGTVKVRDAYVMDLPVTIIAASKSAQIAVITAFETAIGTNNAVTLTRRLPTDTAGTYADTTCNAEYLGGMSLDSINYLTGRTTLSFVNLDGGWS